MQVGSPWAPGPCLTSWRAAALGRIHWLRESAHHGGPGRNLTDESLEWILFSCLSVRTIILNYPKSWELQAAYGLVSDK